MTDSAEVFPALDETDLALLEYIETDFDVNLEVLSNELDLSKSAVHYRLNKLKEHGVIRGISADLNPLAFGLDMTMLTNVSVTHESGYAEDIGEELASLAGVQQVYYTMGDADFVVISRLQNREQVNDLINGIVAIDGVNETTSRFVMRELKTDTRALSNMSDQMHQEVLERE
jgi:DNA-binding Lrp family transcriptional regulator